MAEFSELGLPKQLVTRLTKLGLTDATPIQNRAIPHALNGQDVMGLAQTGTGKTMAFGLPLVAQLMRYGSKPAPYTVRGLVLAPTRELANQIAAALKSLTEGTPFKVGLVVGGVAIKPQIQRVSRGTDVIVATPGRLIDLMERQAFDFSDTDFLVLDEADQMLDLGFIHALRQIADALPEERQTMLFSATMAKQMNEIAQSYLRNPVRVQVAVPGQTADKITQSVHYIAKAEKTSLLLELLKEHEEDASIIFVRTKHGAERLMKTLVAKGFAADSVHGNKSQGQRERAIRGFRSGETKILVATDVAARGLDIPVVRHVYNYELPNVPENYVHRIGRTARAGMDGAAIAFCAPDECDEFKAILKVIKTDIATASGTPWMDLDDSKPKGRGPRRGGGRPGRGKPGQRSGGGGRPGGKQAEARQAGGSAAEANPNSGKPGGGRPRGNRPAGGKHGGGKPGAGRRRFGGGGGRGKPKVARG